MLRFIVSLGTMMVGWWDLESGIILRTAWTRKVPIGNACSRDTAAKAWHGSGTE